MYNILNKITEKANNEALYTFINSIHQQLDDKLEEDISDEKDLQYIYGARDMLDKVENFLNNN